MTFRTLGRRTTTGVALAALIATGPAVAPAQAAGDLVVTNTDDSGPGSLREALTQANASPADDRITFAPAVKGTIALSNGQLEATVGGDSGNLMIDGPGADVLTIDAQRQSRVLDATGVSGSSTPSLELDGLTLTRGSVSDEAGGSLRAVDADVALRGLTIEDNRAWMVNNFATSSGGGVSVTASEGGQASLVVDSCMVAGNHASHSGGGLHASSGVPVTVTRSTIQDNTASAAFSPGMEAVIVYGWGGGISGGPIELADSSVVDNDARLSGGGVNATSLDITGSTVAGNSARGGGGVHLSGSEAGDTLTSSSSTFTRNHARHGGAIGVSDDGSSAELTLTTVADNSAMVGGGIYTPSAMRLTSSVVAMNTGGDLAGDGSAVADHSHVQDPRAFPVSGAGGSATASDPVLRILTEAGGPTATMLPAPNSPLIDAAASFGATADQRGSSRPVDDGRVPDVADATDTGAVELSAGELVGPDQLVSLERPTIAGVARVDEVLRTSGGVWSHAPAQLSYQWLRDGVPIEGATSSTYKVTSADRGAYFYTDSRRVLSVRVAAESPGLLSAYAESDSTDFIGRAQFTMEGRPKVKGETRVGSTLRARPRIGAVTPQPARIQIKWVVGGKRIRSSDGERTLRLRPRMRGHDVRVVFAYKAQNRDMLRHVVRKPRRVR